MSAGTGTQHSEFNHSKREPVHFLQIWILPEQQGLKPDYEQTTFANAERQNKPRLVGSRDGRNGSVTIHQDIDLYASLLDQDAQVTHRLCNGRKAWVQIARGTVQLNATRLAAGDGVAVAEEDAIALQGISPGAEVLLFDMA
jgi:redox-sensitive bicupin YhaK (pirin superfamily)